MKISTQSIINGPVRDRRHFSSLLNAEVKVRHAWTAVQSKAYICSNNIWRIPARKGAIELESTDASVSWDRRGAYEVPVYRSTENAIGDFKATIPNPGNIISILMNVKVTRLATPAWGINWADTFIWYAPNRTTTLRTLNNGTHINVGSPGPMNEWKFEAVVIDLNNSQVAASSNNHEWATATATGFEPQSDDNISLSIGQGGAARPFQNGMISDFAVVSGDARDMPDMMSAWNEYNIYGYASL